MSPTTLAVITGVIVAWCLVSRLLGRIDVTAPMAFVLCGLLLGGPNLLDVSLSSEGAKVIAEATLVLLLFNDAARIHLTPLRHDRGMPLRLLGIGLPLTIGAGMLAAWLLFPGTPVWGLVLVAACLAPTDAGLGAGIVTDERLPSRVRRALNVESGLNDGIVSPLILLAIAILAGEENHTSGFLSHALRELGVGAIVGVAVGAGGGWLLAQANRRGLSERGADALAAVALSVGAYTAALALSGNGFVAAFVAGMSFGPFRRSLEESTLELGEQVGQLIATVVWFVFGAAMLRPALEDLTWQVGLYAVMSLTLVRMVPVALALWGKRLGGPTVAFIGWFGPRGMASIVFALLAFDDLGSDAQTLVSLVSITVALSVLAHGVSATPLIERYSKVVADTDADAPVRRHVPVLGARRSLGRVHQP